MEGLEYTVPAIELSHVSFSYKNRSKVLKDVCFSLAHGQSLTILGPNGSGKTTLLNCILDNNVDYKGVIKIFGADLKEITHKEYAKIIGYVPQLAQLNFEYSVEDFVVMGRNPHKSFFSQPSDYDYEDVQNNLGVLGIDSLAKQMMSEISGGERQLAYIARAITQHPKIIVMDEPTSALDYSNQYKVIQVLKQLNKDGYTTIMTSHNPEYAFMLGGFVGMIDANHNFSFGKTQDILTEDNLSELYGMEIKVKYLAKYDKYVCIRIK